MNNPATQDTKVSDHAILAVDGQGSREQKRFARALLDGDAATIWMMFEQEEPGYLFKGFAGEALLALTATVGNRDILHIFQHHGFPSSTRVRFGALRNMLSCSLREVPAERIDMMMENGLICG